MISRKNKIEHKSLKRIINKPARSSHIRSPDLKKARLAHETSLNNTQADNTSNITSPKEGPVTSIKNFGTPCTKGRLNTIRDRFRN